MWKYNKYIYDESRRFEKVFPTYEVFETQTRPLFLIEYNIEQMEIVYNRLKARYGNSYFAYKNIGTIYERNAEKVEVIASNLLYYNILKKQLDKEITNITTSKNYDTDNEPNVNLVGGLTDKNEFENMEMVSYQKLQNSLNSLLTKINKLYQGYGDLMLNNEYYKRGDVFNEN